MAYKDPALINSSYTVLFHLFMVALSLFFAGTFPAEVRSFALAASLLYSAGIFWFLFFLKQFHDAKIIFALIFSFLMATAILGFISAVHGPLTGGAVPTPSIRPLHIWVIRINAEASWSLIYAATVVGYGYLAYLASVWLASIAEYVYERTLQRLLPRFTRRRLAALDKHIDRASISVSDKFFLMNQWMGVIVTSIVLIVLIGFYSALLLVF